MEDSVDFPFPECTFMFNSVAVSNIESVETKVDFPFPECTSTCNFVAIGLGFPFLECT